MYSSYLKTTAAAVVHNFNNHVSICVVMGSEIECTVIVLQIRVFHAG